MSYLIVFVGAGIGGTGARDDDVELLQAHPRVIRMAQSPRKRPASAPTADPPT